MKIMRSNYDKRHRCPGWSGPAWLSIQKSVCPGQTSVPDVYDGKLSTFRIHQHRECGTIILPSALRWLEWKTYRYQWRDLLPYRILWWFEDRS